jgi:hypothetical protein
VGLKGEKCKITELQPAGVGRQLAKRREGPAGVPVTGEGGGLPVPMGRRRLSPKEGGELPVPMGRRCHLPKEGGGPPVPMGCRCLLPKEGCGLPVPVGRRCLSPRGPMGGRLDPRGQGHG